MKHKIKIPVERSLFGFKKTVGGYSDADVRRNILSNPFIRFEDMQMLHHTKAFGIIEVEPTVWKHLTDKEKIEIMNTCDEKLR